MPDPRPAIRCPQCQAEVPVADADPSCCGRRRRCRWACLAGGGLLLLALLVLGYRYRAHLQAALQLANETTGSTTVTLAALGCGVFLGLCVLGWLLLPFLAAWAYLDLRRRLPRR